MPVNFTKRNWLNGPGGGTPIDAANLNRLEAAIEDLATSALDEATADATYAPIYPSAVSSVLGWSSVLEAGAVPAVEITDASVSAASSTVTSAGGKFTPEMNGHYFYLHRGGPVLVTGAYAWEASPLIGTFTYVSATSGTLSAPTTTAVSGGTIVIGPDSTEAINEAIAAGVGYVPPNVSLMITGEIEVGSAQSFVGGSELSSRIYSVVAKANMITSAFTSAPVVRSLALYGNGWGGQPPNTWPGDGVKPNWANSGCGIIYAHVTGGKIENVNVFHTGGNGTTTDRNGIAGIYLTFGCRNTSVDRCTTTYCRNGINEDNFFSDLAHQAYASPLYNTFTNNLTTYCRFGIALDSGSLARGALIAHHVAQYCVLNGVDIHTTGYVTLIAPRAEYCGRTGTSAPGIAVYGTSSTVNAANVSIINPVCFANGTHGIKISEWITDWRIIGGTCTNNFGTGVYVNNQAHNGTILGLSTRANSRAGSGDAGVRITSSQRINVDVNSYDDQSTPTQAWGVFADGTADFINVLDSSRFSGNTVGAVSLAGANSRWGSKTRSAVGLAAQGLKGEPFPRANITGTLTMPVTQQMATLVPLMQGDTVTNIMFQTVAAAAGITLAKVGVWNSVGTLVASSADISATVMGAAGLKVAALSTPYVVPADGGYYLGLLNVGTTGPGVIRGTSGVSGSGHPVSGFLPPAAAVNGLSDLGTLTLAGSTNAVWYGWS